MSRAADFEKIFLGESVDTPQIISNVDKLWYAIINGAAVVPIIPQTPIEKYLAYLIDNTVIIPSPKTRLDKILYAICTGGTLENFEPLSENEYLLLKYLNKEKNNLFDITSVTSFYTWDGSTAYGSSISDGILIAAVGIYGMDIYCNSNITSLDAGTYKLSADIMLDFDEGLKDIVIGLRQGENTQYARESLSKYKEWERKSYTFTLTETVSIFGFLFQPVGDASNYNNLPTKFKNIELIKIS